MKPDDLELDQLLSRGRLSGRQYDEIEARVLHRAVPEQKRFPWAVLLPPVTSVALASVLLVNNGTFERAESRSSQGELRAKGSPASAAPAGSAKAKPLLVDVGCGGATARACRAGDTLMFSFSGHVAGFVGAFAERLGETPAQRIWYFRGQGMPRLDSAGKTTVLPQGVELGAPHVPGRYRVTVWVAPAASTATEPPPDAASATASFEILP